MSAISLDHIVKTWGAMRAVDDVSLTAEEGSLLVLLGPSGCGKSTTLRLIAGLEQPDGGRVLIGGTDVTGQSPAQRRISMVFQSYALFPHLTVAENIVFGLRVRGVARGERDARLKRVADIVGLAHLLERKPAQLSGGQRQRVALGRAIIAEARVCLMDEPLSNLDAKLRHEMRTEIRALQQRLGMTMVYVTHDQTEAMTMADRVVLMRDGRIEQNGSPEELYRRPATAFTARFIGTPPMNLIAAGDTLTGVRPEHVRIVGESGRHARVRSVEHLGADSIVLCDVDDQAVAVRQDGFSKAAPGDEVRLAWSAADEHIFDNTSGRRRDAAVAPSAAG
ncbi:ABC transporter ATP-binding protein [Bradyrhizobium sp. U87765 SZCCT0131]|uniref:ABC transporter ATP-binding protein n=1 Tax=unclassified Bradyrhizobium TaxID=2631580 RepID=UPI001BABCC97|nr:MULTISPECIES: ABC transporter ATP-binding protein [unclassified Bradyrhizobium]MBR1218351.1 ABC transporter ATP-binding protein [Bradyrhizobium sp. U87765 SZCCT0131]MBR1260703.1 ABC transporter ATP-binding protein [Bradyrhizobium sp. U87765 SZCCT0134]MBR1303849.1 ABC transporter ATP-binding protein [Bradyrhizobium sp. U87765 SZCCT0110]MBR1319455.1 ABC transporter ATP-binding protein [Bradyrhizobium sp. U87765 SZCCT0109]MBR1347780.1 ABC transporter ATP-binding protein [Bradyrhizobium sp. U87